MHIQVEMHVGYGGVEMPRRIHVDGRDIDVVENLDQWHGPNYRYFKFKGNDGNLYILRLDEDRTEWDLTLFRTPRGEDLWLQSVANEQHVAHRRSHKRKH